MTVRGISFAWFGALAFNLVVFAALLGVPPANHSVDLKGDTPIVVIGSSLSGHAFPAEPPENGILGDGRAHVLWAIDEITERQCFALLDSALSQGAETVLVEANTFVFDFAPFSRTLNVKQLPHNLTATVRDHWRSALGLKALDWTRIYDGRISDEVLTEEPSDVQKWYPISFKSDDESRKLGTYIQQANARGIELVLFEPPRSAMLMSGLSSDEISRTQDRMRDLGGEGAVKSILFDPAWPNEMFHDINSHLNRTGRSRFLAELSARYEALR